MSPVVSWSYLALVAVAVMLLAGRAEHKLAMVLVLAWLLGYPALIQADIMPHLTILGFDLQPTRILLITMLPLLTMYRLRQARLRERGFAPLTPAEFLLIGYVFFAIVSMIWNYSALGTRLVVSGIEKELAFGTLYFAARDYMQQRDRQVLLKAIVLYAAFSAVVGLVQFSLAPSFFRVGSYRPAFGDVARSTGAFLQEYEQGMFLTFAAIVASLGTKRIGLRQAALLALFMGGVIVTFQRMPALAFILGAGLVFYVRTFHRPAARIFGAVIGGLAAIVAVLIPWLDVLPASFIYGRLLENTLSIRLAINAFALSLLAKYPLGLGFTSASPVYNMEYYWAGVPGFNSTVAAGLVVHNGFLSAAVRFGIGGGLAFAGMLLGYVLGFARRASLATPRTFIPLLICGIFVLYNLTQDFAFAESQAMLVFALLMGCYGSALQPRQALAPRTNWGWRTGHLGAGVSGGEATE